VGKAKKPAVYVVTGRGFFLLKIKILFLKKQIENARDTAVFEKHSPNTSGPTNFNPSRSAFCGCCQFHWLA